MKITVVRAGELGSAEIGRWRSIQDSTPDLASPYFSPEFTKIVGEVRNDAYVGVMEQDGAIVGFFPHQRRRFGHGSPAGGSFSDFHGVVAAPGTAWEADALLRGCGLVSWEFHHLLASQAPFAGSHARVEESNFMDLSGGFETYAAGLGEAGQGQIREVAVKRRRIARDFKKAEFVPHVADPKLLETLLEWKSAQYRASGLRDNFSFAWTGDLLRRIHAFQSPDFAGMLSALYLDGAPAAVHFGMRSRSVWNWWFPRHDEAFGKYSPGILLRIHAAEHAPSIGIRRIDLGVGEEGTYKPRLRSGGIPVATGRAERRSIAMALLRWREGAEAWVRRSPLRGIARVPGRLIKRFERWNRFR